MRTECLRFVLLARKRAREDDMNDYVCTGEGHTLRMLFALITRVHKEDCKTIGRKDNKHASERQKGPFIICNGEDIMQYTKACRKY